MSHHLLLFGLGFVILLVAWLPLLLRRLPLSLPIICMAIGVALSFTPWFRVRIEDLGSSSSAERLSEMVVLIALMGAGLRIDRGFGRVKWRSTWRLLGVVMPLTIVALFVVGHWGLGMSAAAALLLAAALSPTDPVLAADVQTGPPGAGEDGETRFGLTSEAGLNDGLAFPFILLAVALQKGVQNWGEWLSVELLGALALGIAIGWAVGWIAGYLMFRLPWLKLSDTGDGLVAIGVTLLCYAGTSALHGNGFVAVFVAALAIRSTRPDSEFHRAMSEFSGQIERLLLMLLLIGFGWALGRGLLTGLTWSGAALGLALLFVVRPIAAWVGFLGADVPHASRRLMGFFGIRGIGTLFYLQYAFNRAIFAERDQIWTIAGFTILCSVLLHGMSSTPLMTRADERRRRREQESAPAGG